MTHSNDIAKLDLVVRRTAFWKKAALLFILALPGLWAGRLIVRYGVDVPFLEQWDFLWPLFEKLHTGTLRASDFFSPPSPGMHEQRVFFPRLIAFGLAMLTHWNIRAELLLNWVLDCLTAANLWRLATVTSSVSRRGMYGLLFLAFTLWFTPMKMEIWVNGAGDTLVPLTAACVTTCLWIAPSVRFPHNCLLTMALSTICTFSSVAGIVCWILTLPLLWLAVRTSASRQKPAWVLIWLLAFGTCLVIWFRGFGNLSSDSDLTGFIKHPLEAVQFFLAYLGSAFALGTQLDGTMVAQVTGTVIVAMLAVVARYVWRYRHNAELLSKVLPWLMLALYALLNAAITTTGRWNLGNIQALSSRYLGFSLAVPVSLLFLTSAIFAHRHACGVAPRRTTWWRIGWTALFTALFLLHGLGVLTQPMRPDPKSKIPCPPGREAWQVVHHDRLAMRALLLLINVVDEPGTVVRVTLMDEPLMLKARVNFLDRLGFFRPRLVRSHALRTIMGVTRRSPKEFGEIQRVEPVAGREIALAGWAVLPDKGRQADAVLLTYEHGERGPIIFALAMVEKFRQDLTDPGHQSRYRLKSGWDKVFNSDRLPTGAGEVRAWAFDAEDCRAYPIHGSVNVSIASP